MGSFAEQVVVLDDGPPPSLVMCFVCGTGMKEPGCRIVGTNVSHSGSPLSHKIGNLVGNNFCIMVSRFDELCKRCSDLIENVDELEFNLKMAKKEVMTLLEAKYNFTFVRVDNSSKDVINEVELIDSEIPAQDLIISEDLTENPTIDELNSSLRYSNSMQENTNTETIQYEIICEICSLFFSSVEEYDIHVGKWHKSEITQIIQSSESDTSNIQNNFFKLIKNEDNQNDSGNNASCESFQSEIKPEVKTSVNEREEAVSERTEDITLEILVKNESPESKDQSTSSNNYSYKCGSCDFQHEDKATVKSHFRTHSSSNSRKPVVCEICEMPFPNMSVLSRHMQVHEKSEGPVNCHVCGKQCHDALHAQYHRRNEHNITQQLTCGLCNVTVESNFELKNHILVMHRGKKEFKCKECGKIFSRHLQFENHKLYAHGNSECRICGKNISDPVKLRQHELRHARTDLKKFICEFCNREFKTPGGLRVHKVSHTGKYKFFCEFCGRGFMSSVILEEHKGVHTKEERYICDICGRKFVLYSTFHLHKQWHKNPYPFPCRVCGLKFRYRSERSNHIRRDHTGETPHKCPYCDAAFIKSGCLKKHLSSHTKKFPFNCEICHKGFDLKRALARHLSKTHNDNTLLDSIPKKCQYKVALRPDEYPEEVIC